MGRGKLLSAACNIPYLLLKYGHHKGRAAQIHAQLSLVLEPLGCPPNVHQLGKLQPSNFRQFQILIYGRKVARPILISKGDCDFLSCCQFLCIAMEAVSSLSVNTERGKHCITLIMHGHLMSFGMSGEIREGQCSLLVHLSYMLSCMVWQHGCPDTQGQVTLSAIASQLLHIAARLC